MIHIVIPVFGFMCAFMGLIFLAGCFARVDAPRFIERASGNQQKIDKLRSLQTAWDKLGKIRQLIASATGYWIMAAGLLLLWHDPGLARYRWVVPAMYAINLIALLRVRRHARRVLDQASAGAVEVLQVIKQQISICISFSVIYVMLATKA
ncbi:hypothetical protein [Lysobacter sp. CA196]|uniref:hypothetical protein n=1 Tax=Lysobacter sp. CA196 TaxID=3455606 RepID=UPI003F8D807E